MKRMQYRWSRDHPKKLLTGIGGYVQYVLIAVLVVFCAGMVSNLIYTANLELPGKTENTHPMIPDTYQSSGDTPMIDLNDLVEW